jgi:hypothetical protein
MPILSLGQLASIATTFSGGRADLALSEVSTYVNLAYSEVRTRAGLKHTPVESLAVSSTTTGEDRIATPSDFDYAIALSLHVGSSSTISTSHTTAIITLTPKDVAWKDAQPLASGEPSHYIVYGPNIEFYPSPNSAFSALLRYAAQTPTLVASTDTPSLDERWHAAVAWKAAEITSASRGDVDNEALNRNRYINYVTSCRVDASDKQQDRRGMHVTLGWKRSQ